MKKPDIKAELDRLKVNYNPNTNKDELYHLMLDEQNKEEARESEPDPNDNGQEPSNSKSESEEQQVSPKIEAGDEKVDIVYPISSESVWEDNELRYSIRSLEKYFHNLGTIYIIGHVPDFLSPDQENLIHIDFPDTYTENKDANIISKLLRACLEHDLSERFVFMSDDQYFLKELTIADIEQPVYSVDLANRKFNTGNKWERRLQRTYKALTARGFHGYEYDTHGPVVINKERFRKVMLSYDFGATPGYCINSLYFSHVLEEHKQRNGEIMRIINAKPNRDQILKSLSDAYFLNHNDQALKSGLPDVLEELFPEPSTLE